MYDLICKSVYLPVIDRSKRSRFQNVLEEAERNQYLPAVEYATLQLEKLKRLVRHAELHSPFYRESFREHGVSSADIKDLADIRKFPLLTKDQVFVGAERIKCPVFEGKLFSATTSGSTGIAMRFYQDSCQYTWAAVCQWRGRRWWGLNRWDRQVTLWGRPLWGGASRSLWTAAKYRLRNSLQFSTFEEFDEGKVREIVRAITEFRPKLIYGYGSSLGKVASYMKEQGIALSDPRPLMVEFTADHMFDAEKRAVREVFGVPALSAYGASETPGISQQCREGNSHIAVDNVVIEFLRPDGTPASAGETAEIVVTTLNNFGMPLIRYRVGDTGSFSEGICTCGVTFPLMNLELGKAVDLISTSARSSVSATGQSTWEWRAVVGQ